MTKPMIVPTAQDVVTAYDRFRLALFDGFDEESGQSLCDMQDVVANTLACFLAGEPDLVPEALQNATLDLKRTLRKWNPVRIETVAKDLLLFKSFLRAKCHAFKLRRDGSIAKAMAFEQTAEWAYGQLSQDFRW